MLAFICIHLDFITDVSRRETATEDKDFRYHLRLNRLLEQPSESLDHPVLIQPHIGNKQYREIGVLGALGLLYPPFLTGISRVEQRPKGDGPLTSSSTVVAPFPRKSTCPYIDLRFVNSGLVLGKSHIPCYGTTFGRRMSDCDYHQRFFVAVVPFHQYKASLCKQALAGTLQSFRLTTPRRDRQKLSLPFEKCQVGPYHPDPPNTAGLRVIA